MKKRRFLILMALLLTVVVFFWGVDQGCAQSNAKSKADVQKQVGRDFDSATQRMKSRMELPKLRKDAAKRFKETRAASASKKEAPGEMEGGTNK